MKAKVLTKSLLDQYPVWKWNETGDMRCPVILSDDFPETEPALFIKASFKAPNDERFDGYLTGKTTFYAFALFSGSAVFHFNLNLPEMAFEQLQTMANFLGKPNMELFPLHYEANVLPGKPAIQGFLTLQNDAKN